jgi:hypothetical protein
MLSLVRMRSRVRRSEVRLSSGKAKEQAVMADFGKSEDAEP